LKAVGWKIGKDKKMIICAFVAGLIVAAAIVGYLDRGDWRGVFDYITFPFWIIGAFIYAFVREVDRFYKIFARKPTTLVVG
jgi:hypothetical protein